MRQVGEDPDYRFTLANERTFLAWIRTSLALLAGGIAVVQLVPSFSVPAGRHLLGIPLVLLSIVLSVYSYRHWAAAERSIRLRRPLPPSVLPPLLGAATAVISLLALIIIAVSSGGK
jgi:putative membrane protein